MNIPLKVGKYLVSVTNSIVIGPFHKPSFPLEPFVSGLHPRAQLRLSSSFSRSSLSTLPPLLFLSSAAVFHLLPGMSLNA